MVSLIAGAFTAHLDRWDGLQSCVTPLISTRRGKVHARTLASCVGHMRSIRSSVGPTAQPFIRHLYRVLNSRMFGRVSWVALSTDSFGEQRHWQPLSHIFSI
jgi:hypothetical protein